MVQKGQEILTAKQIADDAEYLQEATAAITNAVHDYAQLYREHNAAQRTIAGLRARNAELLRRNATDMGLSAVVTTTYRLCYGRLPDSIRMNQVRDLLGATLTRMRLIGTSPRYVLDPVRKPAVLPPHKHTVNQLDTESFVANEGGR